MGPRFFALAILALGGCGSEAPSKTPGAPTTPPDEQYETGGAAGHRVLVWHCDARHERLVLHQFCGEGLTGCGAWQLDRTLCPADPALEAAVRTPFERELQREAALHPSQRDHHPIPDGYGWR